MSKRKNRKEELNIKRLVCYAERYRTSEGKSSISVESAGFRHGLPSPSTMRRVMEMIKPEALENVYRQWVRPYIGSCIGKQISVDGKTMRGASGMGDINLHMVSAWIQEDGSRWDR